MVFEIVDLDVWGNANDGYEVNDSFHTGRTVEIDPMLPHRKFFEQLKSQGVISSFAGMEVDEGISFEDVICIVNKSDGKPLFDLERVVL